LVGDISAEQSYTVSGNHLNEDITITAPAGFEISKSSGGIGHSSLTLPEILGSVSPTDIYARFVPAAEEEYNGNITHASAGANTALVSVSGTGVVPTLDVSPSSLNYGDIETGDSLIMSYSMTGIQLTGDVTITAPSGFFVSFLNDAGFAGSATVTPASGEIDTTVYVMFKPIAETDYTGNVTNENSEVTTQNVAVSGTGVPVGTPIISVTESSVIFGELHIDSSEIRTYNVTGVNLSENIEVALSGAGYEISGDGITFGTANIILPHAGGVVDTSIWVKFSPEAVQNYSGTISHTSTGATQQDITLDGDGVQAEITVTGTLSDFGEIEVGETSEEQSYTVSGNNLIDDVDIIAPDGFEISLTSGSGFTDSIRIVQTGGNISGTNVFVRFAPIASGNYADNITHKSAGADMVSQPVSGTTGDVPVVIITGNLDDFGDVEIHQHSDEQSYSVSGSNLTEGIEIIAPDGFEISQTSGSNFNDTIVLALSGDSVPVTEIFVRFSPVDDTSYNDSISHNSNNAAIIYQPVSGTTTTSIITTDQQELLLYPVPTKGILYLNTALNGVKVIQVMDILGNIFIEKSNVEQLESIDLTGLPAGTYIIVIQTDNKIMTKKVGKL